MQAQGGRRGSAGRALAPSALEASPAWYTSPSRRRWPCRRPDPQHGPDGPAALGARLAYGAEHVASSAAVSLTLRW